MDQIIEEIIKTASIGGGIAMIIALCEWVVCFFVRAIKDKLGR